MEILLLCYEYPPIGGGGGIAAQRYAEAWQAAGHKVTVLTSRTMGLEAREAVHGVQIVRVPTVGRPDRATSTFLSMLCYNVTGLIHVLRHRRVLRRFQVINSHFSIPTGPLGHLTAKFLGRPHVLTIIGGDIYDPSKRSSPHRSRLMRWINRWLINGSDRVIAISSDTKKRAEQYYDIRRSIRVINYGFQPSPSGTLAETIPQLEPGRYFLIAIGRLVERKGFDHLIRAMKHLPEEVELLLIGDGPLAPVLEQLAVEEGVSQRVRLLGYLSRQQIQQYLHRSDCFVLSSLHEGLGIVVQEAMDAGLPVVATDNGGQVDLIRYPRNGILVPIADAEALADAVRTLYSDRKLAKSMGLNNLADIQQQHIENNCQLYLDEFREVIKPEEMSRTKEFS